MVTFVFMRDDSFFLGSLLCLYKDFVGVTSVFVGSFTLKRGDPERIILSKHRSDSKKSDIP